MSYFQILLSYLASFLLFFFAPSINILKGVAASEINQGFSRTVLKNLPCTGGGPKLILTI